VRTSLSRVAAVWIALATPLAIVALTLPLFLNPLWVSFEQGRAEATAWTGFSEPQLRSATDAILADLVVGPPEFDVAVAGEPVLNERERSHMHDVRGVFVGFFAIALIAVAGGIVIAARRSGEERAASWRAVRAGSLGLVAVLVIVGVVSVVAFGPLFEAFHRVFFAGGSYTFDPGADRLVQLFPFRFWQETAIAVGIVCIGVALVVAAIASRRLSAGGAVTATATLEGSRP
jgi:integral membrane protein (TIGR01906 family)